MTKTQKKLRELRARQSTERGRMAELGLADELTDETRAELDTIEQGTPDLERQIRAATVAVEAEEAEQRAAAKAWRACRRAPMARIASALELRAKVRLGSLRCKLQSRQRAAVDGAGVASYNASGGDCGANRFPLELLAPPPARQRRRRRTPRRPPESTLHDHAAHVGLTACSPRRLPCGLVSPWKACRSGAASYPRHDGGRGCSATRQGRKRLADTATWMVSVDRIETQAQRRATLKFSIEDTARIPGLEAALTRDHSHGAHRGH